MRVPERDDVAGGVEIDLTLEKRGVRRVADGDEDAVERQLDCRAGLQVPDDDARDLALRDVLDLGDLRIPDELDLRVRERLVLHDLRRAQMSRRWITVTFEANFVR